MSTVAERVTRNASYSLVGSIFAFVAGVVASVALARLLAPPQLGSFALVLSAGGLMGMLVTLGIPHAATKYVAEYVSRGERGTAGTVLVALGRLEVGLAVAVGVLGFLLAPRLGEAFDAPGFVPAFRIGAAALVPGVLAGLAQAGLQGLQDYRRVTLISLATTTFLLASTVGLLAAGGGVVGAVAAIAATSVLATTLNIRALRGQLDLPVGRGSLPPAARAKLRRYIPAVSAVLLLDAVVWQRSEVFFLGLFRTPREVAWYALAFGVAATVMGLLPRAVSAVLAPVASGLYGGSDRVGLRTLFLTGSRYMVILACPIVVGGALLARPLLITVYGAEYAPAAMAFPLVLLGAGFGAVGAVTASIQTGMERQGTVLKVAVAATVVNLALDVALIPRWGVVGAAVANAVAQTGAVVAGIAITARLVGAGFPLRDSLRAMVSAGGVGAAAYVLARTVSGPAGLAAAVAVAALLYPVALLATRALRTEDLARLLAVRAVLPQRLRRGYGGLLRLAERWAS